MDSSRTRSVIGHPAHPGTGRRSHRNRHRPEDVINALRVVWRTNPSTISEPEDGAPVASSVATAGSARVFITLSP